jgi:hypothetical protein
MNLVNEMSGEGLRREFGFGPADEQRVIDLKGGGGAAFDGHD